MRARTALALAFALSAAPATARAQDKYALGVFHFNVQYVAGGLQGFLGATADNDEVEDAIIVQSFKPVLDLYQKHPTWGVDLEMQGYMLDIIGERHPDVLDELKSLAKSGQIEVVSFHYSDQLFTAFPAQDWERSQALTAATFKKWDVPLGQSVFCQEGQAGAAMAAAMKAHGYRTMMWPKNLWSYQHSSFDQDAKPLYKFGDVFMVTAGKGVTYTEGTTSIQTTWTYMDDGELMATGGIDPYFPDSFKTKASAVADYESGVAALETQGYQITTVDKFVTAVSGKITPADPPPLMDGTWQPNSTTAELKWLGGKGVWSKDERDNDVRSLNALAHRELTAAETAAKVAGVDARTELDSAWRLLFLSEVSDGTGINPFRGEVEYALAHSSEALRIARDVIQQAKDAKKADTVVIDPAAGTMESKTEPDPMRGTAEDSGPLTLVVKNGDRQYTTSWENVGNGHHRVAITFGPSEAAFPISVTFPGTVQDDLVTTLALDDATPITFHRSDFTFDDFYMALPTGLLSLGGNLWVVKEQADVHLAAHIRRDTGDVVFEDQVFPLADSATWVFHVFEGSAADAVALANSINVSRRVAR